MNARQARSAIQRMIVGITLMVVTLAAVAQGPGQRPGMPHQAGISPRVREIVQTYGNMPPNEFAAFYQAESPEILPVLSAMEQNDAEAFEDYTRELVDRYAEYRELTREEPGHAAEFLAWIQMSTRAEALAARIRKISQDDPNAPVLPKLKGDLHNLLRRLFEDEMKANQQEVKMLRQEAAELERRLQRRTENKEFLIRKRLLEMTGKEEDMEW